MEKCLGHISDEASRKGMEENAVIAYNGMYLQDFLLDRGESLYPLEPPDDLFVEDEEQMPVLVNGIPQEDDINYGEPINAEKYHNVIFLDYASRPNYSDENAAVTIQIGGKTFRLRVGEYHFDGMSGRLSVYDPSIKDEIILCYHFVVPIAITKGSAGETVDIAYYRDDEWHELHNLKKGLSAVNDIFRCNFGIGSLYQTTFPKA